MNETLLVTGAGGFIGGHLVAQLRKLGYRRLRAVDIKPPSDWFQRFDDVENVTADLREKASCYSVCEGVSSIYNLAADMGGIGFITGNKVACMLSVLINTHLLMAALEKRVSRYFFSSTACVYNTAKQTDPQALALKESDAYPAMPEDGYGWEKLFGEHMCRHFREEFGLATRVARFHNSYGPFGTWRGGREKAPASLCRKIIEAKYQGTGEIEIWGDGEQTRSFMYVNDNIEGILKIMDSDIELPINLGSSERVTINQLVDIIEEIAGFNVRRRYLLDKPQGVCGRNSDNTLILEKLGWEPTTPLTQGLVTTYRWIEQEYLNTVGKP
ncbi:MAG: NAD-dependent epimerase/dehydratase family protein [Alphaproteobacteria bacterium]|nr:NAD-dependent epimerase/dehydratase family protein [Alphaproteobacteria bacterium]